MATGTPIDDIFPFINEIFLVQTDENRPDGARQTFVQGESLPVPVTGVPELHLLRRYSLSVLFLPLPDSLDEFPASHVVTRKAFLRQLALDDVLRRNAGVIGSREP